MTPAAFAMLSAAAEKEFLAAFATQDLDAIESALTLPSATLGPKVQAA
jgi:hypothetical protein